MTAALIATKFFLPAPRSNLVVRDRLHARFVKGLNSKLTVVSAPAGFGKTTVVSGVARTLDSPVVWVSLEQSDNVLQRFITVIVEAIRHTFTEFGTASGPLLNAMQPPSSEVLLAALLNDLVSITLPLVLVLDDYHAAHTSASDDALAFLLEHQPPNVHLIIVTREHPALPLARLRARGELVEFGAADLRFTTDEALAFFNITMGLTLDESQVVQLEARTEGWVAGLQLAALSLQGRSDNDEFISRFTGSHRFVIDYLAEEVLGRLSEQMRTFLLQCSVLTRFDASLCNAVTESSNSAAMLDTLDRQNLFLIPLDERRQWYRFHHLFADVLHAHLGQSSLNIHQLHKRASAWLQRSGRANDAIDHALQAEDFEAAVRIIECEWPEIRLFEQESTYIRWMDALPETIIATSAYLCTWYGYSLLRMDLSSAPRWLDAAQKQIDAVTPVDNPCGYGAVPGLLANAWAFHAGIIGDTDGVVEHANRALVLLPDDEPISRGFAAALLSLVQWGRGDLTSAYRSMSQGISAMKVGGEISGFIRTMCGLADICIAQGKYKEAARVCCQAVSFAQESTWTPQGLADVHVIQAALAVSELKLDVAQALLKQARALGEHAAMPEAAHAWFVVQAQIESIRGHHNLASDLLEEAREAKNPSPAPDFIPLAAIQARLDILSDDLGAALRWVNACTLSIDDKPAYITEYGHLTLVRLLLARSRRDDDDNSVREALGLLLPLAEAAEAGQRTGSLMDIQLQLALCYQRLGDEAMAILALKAAIRIPEARRQVSKFTADGPGTRRQLLMLISSADAPQWVTDALHKADQHTKRQPDQTSSEQHGKHTLLEPLSDRELDVIRRLGSELNGPQIADQLFVSLNTLRTHTRNIYHKLDVNNRRAAVRRARELGVT